MKKYILKCLIIGKGDKMKTKIIVILFILIFLISSVILIKEKLQKNNKETNNLEINENTIINNDKSYAINSNTYTYTLNGNNIVIKYPNLESDKIDLTLINETIKKQH